MTGRRSDAVNVGVDLAHYPLVCMVDADSILDHGYIPEEHAPDPVMGHGDPTAPGKVAIWLFLASEIMFFIAILGTYIVLRSGSPHLFSEHAAALSKPLAIDEIALMVDQLLARRSSR